MSKKRYAPDLPNSVHHRPGDTAYLRELLAAAGISQRAAGPLLGMNERSMRYRVSGQVPLTYPEQFCLEVLADRRQESEQGETDSATAAPPRDAASRGRIEWHEPGERPLSLADAGKVIVARDKFGETFCGTIIRDQLGLYIQGAVHRVPIERVALYALLDPPPAT